MSSLKVLLYSELDRLTILKEYGKTSEMVSQDIKIMQEWMAKQPHLPEIAERRVIEIFLLVHKFSIERAKPKLDMYYSIRSIFPDLFNNNPNDPSTKKIMDIVYYLPLPKLTDQLHRVTVVRLTGKYLDDFDAARYFAHILNILEIRLREDYCLSDIQIFDHWGFTMNHIIQFTPTIVKKAIFILEKVLTNRAKGIHFINCSGFHGHFINIVKAALKPKLANRVFVHSDMESLFKMIPKDILPKEYGGEEKSLAELNDDWKKKVSEYDSLYQHLRTIKVDNNLRPQESLNSEYLGIQGTFKQLGEVD